MEGNKERKRKRWVLYISKGVCWFIDPKKKVEIILINGFGNENEKLDDFGFKIILTLCYKFYEFRSISFLL